MPDTINLAGCQNLEHHDACQIILLADCIQLAGQLHMYFCACQAVRQLTAWQAQVTA
jgi:hypothetical protein